MGQGLAEELGQPVIIENKAGGGTLMGTDYVAKSAPDGYTLVLASFAHAVNPSLQPKMPYDTARAFQPIGLIGRSYNVLVTSPKPGLRTVEDVRRLLNAGADKTSFNSAAIANPQVICEASAKYGAQCIVVAIDAKRRSAEDEQRIGTHGLPMGPGWDVYSHGGRKNVGLDAVAWATQMAEYGAGEILLTSMDRDGTKSGFDLQLTRAVSDAVSVPVIASGGVGNLDHLADGIQQGGADAVLAASIFHYGEYTVQQAKQRMRERGIPVRL